MKLQSLRHLALTLSFCFATSAASAHEVWIEPLATGQLVVRFAEYGEDYETSPGHLDSLTLPESWKIEADGLVNRLVVKKAADHFALEGAAATMSVQAETVFEVIGGKPGGKGDQAGPSRRPFFYARWYAFGSGAAKPTLNLDLVPTDKPGQVCVYFRGRPLADIEVTVHLPDGKEQDLKSDKDGLVQASVEQSGFYMLHCKRYREQIDGFTGGKAYNAVSHNCSVAWRKP